MVQMFILACVRTLDIKCDLKPCQSQHRDGKLINKYQTLIRSGCCALGVPFTSWKSKRETTSTIQGLLVNQVCVS